MKTKYLSIIVISFLLMISEVWAQVGIGTITPNASAMLDVSSTTQGLLAPRMTTIEKNSITSPANGLLIYDTDLSKFNYYNGSAWTTIETGSSTSRVNYKLVKSVADLSDELAAGGGSTYLLNSTYLYEINGTIVVNFPIDLNEAYIRGQDTRGDILFNNTGTALFTGSKGGNIRDLLIVGNGQPAFNINGSPTQNLVSNSVVYTGCNAVGNLSNLGLVFFNISQFINCTGGLTVSSVTSFLMANVFWTSTSTGTFLSFSGTFDDIQLSSGRVSVDVGEIGIDVSSNPTLNNAGSINGVAFTGIGTRINDYTVGNYLGYSFSKEWDISTPGLITEKDEVATGNLYITTSAITNIIAANTPIKISGATSGLNLFRASSPTDNRIVYNGTKTRYFSYTGSISVTATANNRRFVFYIAKNGTILPESEQSRKIANGADRGSISISGVVQLAPNDYVEVWVENINDATDITIESMNLLIK